MVQGAAVLAGRMFGTTPASMRSQVLFVVRSITNKGLETRRPWARRGPCCRENAGAC